MNTRSKKKNQDHLALVPPDLKKHRKKDRQSANQDTEKTNNPPNKNEDLEDINVRRVVGKLGLDLKNANKTTDQKIDAHQIEIAKLAATIASQKEEIEKLKAALAGLGERVSNLEQLAVKGVTQVIPANEHNVHITGCLGLFSPRSSDYHLHAPNSVLNEPTMNVEQHQDLLSSDLSFNIDNTEFDDTIWAHYALAGGLPSELDDTETTNTLNNSPKPRGF